MVFSKTCKADFGPCQDAAWSFPKSAKLILFLALDHPKPCIPPGDLSQSSPGSRLSICMLLVNRKWTRSLYLGGSLVVSWVLLTRELQLWHIKFQHFNCRTAVFLLVFLPSSSLPNTTFFATQVLSCANAVEPTFFHNCTFFSRGFYSMKKHTIVYKGSFLHFSKGSNFLFFKNHA